MRRDVVRRRGPERQVSTQAQSERPASARLPWWAIPIGAALVILGILLLYAAIGLGWLTLTLILGGLLDALMFESFEATVASYAASLLAVGLLTACSLGAVSRPRLALVLVVLLGALCFVLGSRSAAQPPPLLSLLAGVAGIGSGYVGMRAIACGDRLCSPRHWRQMRLESGVCPLCGYSITGLPECRCPECGATWTREETRGDARASGSPQVTSDG
jgi:hypothetical protein